MAIHSIIFVPGPIVKVKCLTLLFCIQKVLGSILGPEMGHYEVSHGFPQSLQTNAKTVP
jgi:hypothetical protein